MFKKRLRTGNLKANTDGSSKIVKTISAVMFVIMFSKVFGLIRNALIGRLLGKSLEADAFNSALSLTNTFFELTLSAFLVSSFVPVFSEYIQKKDADGAYQFSNSFMNIIMLITGFISILGVFFSNQLISLFTSFPDATVTLLASNILKILFPSIMFIAVAYIMVGILQSSGQFIVPALISSVSNLIIVLYLLVFKMDFGIQGISIIFLLSWLAQVIVQVPALIKKKYRYRLTLDFKNDGVKKVWMLAPSVLISTAYQPIVAIINTKVSSHVEGVKSILDYANMFYVVTIGLMISSMTNVLLPKLSRLNAANDQDEFSGILRKAILAVICIVTPVMTLFILYSRQIIELIYKGGSFDQDAVIHTAATLGCYSIGMLAYALIEISNKSFYAKKKSFVTILTPVIGLTVNVTLIFIFTKLYGISGQSLALASALAVIALAIVLLFFVQKENKIINKRFGISILKVILAEGITLMATFGLKSIHVYAAISSFLRDLFTKIPLGALSEWLSTGMELAVCSGMFVLIYGIILLASSKFKVKNII